MGSVDVISIFVLPSDGSKGASVDVSLSPFKAAES